MAETPRTRRKYSPGFHIQARCTVSYIAVVRTPNGALVGIKSGDDELAEWPSEEDAEAAMEKHILGEAYGYEIIEVDFMSDAYKVEHRGDTEQ